MLLREGEMFPTIKVKVLPVSESWSKRVNFDSRNEATLFTLLDKLAITFPKVVKDWLMFLSSLKCSLLMSSALFTFSEPAKSQRFSLAFLVAAFVLESTLWHRDVLTQAIFGRWYENDCSWYSWKSGEWNGSSLLVSSAQDNPNSEWLHTQPIPPQICHRFSTHAGLTLSVSENPGCEAAYLKKIIDLLIVDLEKGAVDVKVVPLLSSMRVYFLK